VTYVWLSYRLCTVDDRCCGHRNLIGPSRAGVFAVVWMPIYLIAYCIFRFGSEFIRPEERLLAGLTFYRWSSIVIAISMVLILAKRHGARLTNSKPI